MAPMWDENQPRDCVAMLELIDHYISQELAPDERRTVEDHMQACPNCTAALQARLRVRRGLQQGVNAEAAPETLRLSIFQSIRAPQEQPRASVSRLSTMRWYAAAAALVLVVLGGWGIARLVEPSPSAPSITQGGRPAETLDDVTLKAVNLLEIGLGDHLACAVEHGGGEERMTLEEMAASLGPEYNGLLPIVKKHMPNCKLVVAHRCTHGGRRFVHMILRDNERVISLALTRKRGESFARTGCKPHCKVKGIALFEARLQNCRKFEVTGFETREYLAFVVSDELTESTVRFAWALAPDMHAFLEKGTT